MFVVHYLLLAALMALNVANAQSSAAQSNYMLQCQGCHKADGSGIEGVVPDLRTNAVQFLKDQQGRAFYVSVPGSANAPLSDAQLAQVLNYIIEKIVPSEQPTLALFSTAEVSRYRQTKLLNPAEKRKQLVAKYKQKNNLGD